MQFSRIWIVLATGMTLFGSWGCTKRPPLAASPPVADTPGYMLPSFYWSKDKYDVSPGPKSEGKHRHGREHALHSAALSEFGEKECRLFPPTVRATCPLIGHVRKSVDVENGVAIYFMPEMSVEAVVAHMRCHHAFAEAQKFKGGERCALYVRGIEIGKTEDGKGVAIRSQDADTVREIRQRVQEEVEVDQP